MSEKDFNLKITIRNARLLRAVEDQYGSAAEMCRVADISQSALSAIMTMRESPFKKDGNLTVVAEKVVSALGISPGDLWPDHIAMLKAKKSTVEVEISADQFRAIAENDPEKTAIYRDAIERWSRDLNARQVKILAARTQGATYEELAKEFGVGRERIRQIEMKAMRRCRTRAMQDSVRSFTEITQ